MTKPKAIDVFSGCRGLTLGLKLAGFDVIGAVEIDALAAKTYTANHGKVHLWELDIRKLAAPQILRKLGLKRGGLGLRGGTLLFNRGLGGGAAGDGHAEG